MTKKPIILCILDGWGIGDETAPNNAISKAKTPNYDRLLKQYPHSKLQASEHYVGLPDGQVGNSEVGHMTIGAGRVIFQDLPKINNSIKEQKLQKDQKLLNLINNLKKSGGNLHLLGLCSDGNVHASQEHITFIAKFLAENEIKVYLHLFLDGRDTPPKSALEFLDKLDSDLKNHPQIKIATVGGRYYGMDRDKNWSRIKLAYDAIVNAKGDMNAPKFLSAKKAVEESYKNNIFDEFILPAVIGDYQGMKDGDALFSANYRADRIRQISSAILDPNFKEFSTRKTNFVSKLAMTKYSDELEKHYEILFPHEKITNSFGEILEKNNITQLRIAETEKYAHVTFFFSCGREKEFKGEERILVQSPRVPTYDLQPEMSASEVGKHLQEAIKSDKYDVIIVNYANADMVGHTGFLDAAIKACETIDEQLVMLEKLILEKDGLMLISADHGNIECMTDEKNQPHTAHTENVVPFILVGKNLSAVKLQDGGLCDIAPTILNLMQIKQPEEMTGKNLIKKSS